MKTISKYAAFIAIICSSFVACKQEKPELTNSRVVNWNLCTDSTAYESHKLGNEEAESGLRKYKTYIDNVRDTLAKDAPGAFPDMADKLNYGSEVDFDMLLEVLAHRKVECSDKLFVMNAIRPKKEDGKTIKGEFVTEIMFVIESIDKNGTLSHTYFDFTRPCPNGCPKKIPTLEYPPTTNEPIH
ncbi:hypothetical protein [uncultured Kordia sp.]|uniref:hypothetical protein n=1 Tax=uncultured Kordia sp. TaxID=507699 RepID=UPI0026149F12|nr:hypothetical protein [uncultured Kordia sp.]